MSNRYATLADMEARYAIDFTNYQSSWAPTDTAIYHLTNDCLVARASDMIDEYAGTTFASGGIGTTPYNIVEACCQIVKRVLEERHLFIALVGAATISDEWGSLSYQQAIFEIMTPEVRLLIDNERAANAFPLRVTTG